MLRRKRLIRSAGLFASGLVLAAVAFELVMRLVEATPLWRVGPMVEVSLYGPDSQTGYAHRPNVSGYWRTENRAHIRTSAQGLRDSDTSFAKPPSTFRVALFGDSLTEALQVELAKTYQALAERHFAASGRSVQVVNFALAGATPVVSLVRARTYAERFEPDMAVMVHSAGDFLAAAMSDDSRFPAYRRTSSGVYQIGYGFLNTRSYRIRTSDLGRAVYWLTDRSRFVGAVNGRLNVGLFAELDRQSAAPTSRSQAGKCNIRAVEQQLALWRGQSSPRPAGAVLTAFLRDLGAYREVSGHPVALALLGVAPGCGASHPMRLALAAAIRTRLAAHGIAFHDVDAALSANLAPAQSKRVLRGFGSRLGAGHFNEAGHEAMAKLLESIIALHLPRRR